MNKIQLRSVQHLWMYYAGMVGKPGLLSRLHGIIERISTPPDNRAFQSPDPDSDVPSVHAREIKLENEAADHLPKAGIIRLRFCADATGREYILGP